MISIGHRFDFGRRVHVSVAQQLKRPIDSLLRLRGAAHPAPKWISRIERRKRTLLVNRRRGAEIAHFVPTQSCPRGAGHCIGRGYNGVMNDH